MCGIIAIIRKRPDRQAPDPFRLRDLVNSISETVPTNLQDIEEITESITRLETEISGVPGTMTLLENPELMSFLVEKCGRLENSLTDFEILLNGSDSEVGEIEKINAGIIRMKDSLWSLSNDRVRMVKAVSDLCQGQRTESSVGTYISIQEALSAIDRLEVRGRDSAGLHLMIRDHALTLPDPIIEKEIQNRSNDSDYKSKSVRLLGDQISFVYKTASEIGELGDNTRVLREAIKSDLLLHKALANDRASVVVVGHTRWASIGIISEPNAHPLNSEQVDLDQLPYVVAAINGDVDNFADLKETQKLSIDPVVTSDSKVMPTLMAHHLNKSDSSEGATHTAFRKTVDALDGSVAIVANAATDPKNLYVALRGSGQGLYIGLAEDTFIVASEPYGLVESTQRYLRVNGESLPRRNEIVSSPGEIISLSQDQAGSIEGISRTSYEGVSLPVDDHEIEVAGITTRDIDRRGFPHFFLKEITEAPESFQKTLRGKIVETDGNLHVKLNEKSFPSKINNKLKDGEISDIFVIGQGTAAVAGNNLASLLGEEVNLRVESLPSTELSGFRLRGDMSHVLVIAISQSGTTTDTNRTVDLVRARGASVISIVNRRDSELTKKSDGVLYTSDGRDIEMSVASTKAFYSQIAAGVLLGLAIADATNGQLADIQRLDKRNKLLLALREIPNLMRKVLAEQQRISQIAAELAPAKKYWAVVGNGFNIVAAKEIRIKLSELCYKSIAADFTEDKKHIDLSAEPLILVCAAGLEGSVSIDAAKEVAIYRAHKASPIVITNDVEAFPSALKVIEVPSTVPELAFVLSTMAGHLFGYEAALSIDAQAIPFREIRAAIEYAVSESPETTGEVMLGNLKPQIHRASQIYFDGLRSGQYNGHLEASTATKISTMLKYALGTIPLDSYQLDLGKVGTPATILEDLASSLTLGIEELTRTIDTIKHQAKTVTVGISRSDEEMIQLPLVKELLQAGTPRDRISYRNLRCLGALDKGVEDVAGYIRYSIDGDVDTGVAQLHIVDRGGIAVDLVSRVERDSKLRGSKHLVASDQNVMITSGRNDGRIIILVPEVKDKKTVGLTLLHVRLISYVEEQAARQILDGYQNRYARLFDFVTETEPSFRNDLLSKIPLRELLITPIADLAERWRV
ncbi:MAG: SIS domain-containing protein [Acidimicrobiales bacterium]|nr:SIS domain-containing protein [Acidimicrobiales bacterium]